MELVIKLSEKSYNHIKNLGALWIETERGLPIVAKALLEGIPLQKGHGNLKDENYLLSLLECEEYETCTWRNCSDCNHEPCLKRNMVLSAPTIIESDH